MIPFTYVLIVVGGILGIWGATKDRQKAEKAKSEQQVEKEEPANKSSGG